MALLLQKYLGHPVALEYQDHLMGLVDHASPVAAAVVVPVEMKLRSADLLWTVAKKIIQRKRRLQRNQEDGLVAEAVLEVIRVVGHEASQEVKQHLRVDQDHVVSLEVEQKVDQEVVQGQEVNPEADLLLGVDQDHAASLVVVLAPVANQEVGQGVNQAAGQILVVSLGVDPDHAASLEVVKVLV